MLWDLFLLATMALLGALGAAVAHRHLALRGPLGWAFGLPLAMAAFLFLGLTNVHFAGAVPLWASLVETGVLLLVLALLPPLTVEQEQPTDPSFSRGHLVTLAVLYGLTLFHLHSHQLMATETDFFIHFPESNQFHRQNAPPRNPFFPEYPLQGHFGRHLMLASWSTLVSDDVQRAQWLTELVILSNSLWLWCLFLRRISGSAAGATLGTVSVFAGVNVGSRVGLMTTFDTNNGLVYFLLPAVLLIYWELLQRHTWRMTLAAGFLTGVHGAVYETNCAVALAALITAAAFKAGWEPGSRSLKTVARLAVIVVMGVGLTLVQGGILSSLGKRVASGHQDDVKGLGEQNVSLQVSVAFPKSEFLQIRLGNEPYQRYSCSFGTKFLRGLRPALDGGGYAFIFSPKVLLLHWLPTWLAPFMIVWGWRRRRLDAVLLGSFGVVAYVTPGLFNFGPLFEGEYFRWEFSAGVAFAALMGLIMGETWREKPRLKALIIVMIAFNSLAAEKALNDIIKEFHRHPEAARRALTVWYPDTGEWFAEIPDVDFERADIEAVRWLRKNAEPGDRTLSDFSGASHESMIKEAAIGGLSATYMVGHELPAPWTPYGRAPYLASSTTMAFRQTLNPELLAGLGVRWLYISPEQHGRPSGLEPVFRSSDGSREIYEVPGGAPVTPLRRPEETLDIGLTISELPSPDACQSGVAYPVELEFAEPVEGWVTPMLLGEQNQVLNHLAPLTVKAQGRRVTAWFVPPIEEGDFTVRWLLACDDEWKLVGDPVPASYRFAETVEQRLRVVKSDATGVTITNVSEQAFDTGAPVRLSWRIWDRDRGAYRLWIPEGSKLVPMELKPGETRSYSIEKREKPIPNPRYDYFVSAQIGPLLDLQPVNGPSTGERTGE